jgi:hypothetical protein
MSDEYVWAFEAMLEAVEFRKKLENQINDLYMHTYSYRVYKCPFAARVPGASFISDVIAYQSV